MLVFYRSPVLSAHSFYHQIYEMDDIRVDRVCLHSLLYYTFFRISAREYSVLP